MRSSLDKAFIYLCIFWIFVLSSYAVVKISPIIVRFIEMNDSADYTEVFALYEANAENLNVIADCLMEGEYERFHINTGCDENGRPYADFAYEDVIVDDELLIMCDSLISSGEFSTIYKDLEKDDVYFFNVEKSLIKPRKGIAFSLETPTNEYELFEHIEGNWYYYEEID